MHSTLTEHARCFYGDEFGPTPECDLDHREHYFVEELTFADADSILAMLRELCPHMVDGRLPGLGPQPVLPVGAPAAT